MYTVCVYIYIYVSIKFVYIYKHKYIKFVFIYKQTLADRNESDFSDSFPFLHRAKQHSAASFSPRDKGEQQGERERRG